MSDLVKRLRFIATGGGTTTDTSFYIENEAADRIEELEASIYIIIEGWNIPDGARKILETVYYKT